MTKIQLAKAIVQESLKQGDTLITQSSCLAVAKEVLDELDEDEKEYAASRGGVGYKQFSHLFPTEIANKKFDDLRGVFDYLDAVESFENYWVRYNSLEEDKNEELKEHCRIFWMKSREF